MHPGRPRVKDPVSQFLQTSDNDQDMQKRLSDDDI